MKHEISQELLTFVRNWAADTNLLLKKKLPEERIGKTGGLYASIRSDVTELGSDIVYELAFKNYGRFVDMGVGNGVTIEGRYTNRDIAKKRDKKNWYSRTWYGRLHGLRGQVAVKVGEVSLDALKKQIEKPII